MRIVSLLPSITEILCALGRESDLIGRSHECDFPPSVQALPAVTSAKYHSDETSYEINQRIKAIVQEGLSVYRVDADLLASLEPDIVLTQDHCEFCAASYSGVKKAVEQHLEDSLKIVSVSPQDLDDVFLSIQQIAEVVDAEQKGAELLNSLMKRVNNIQAQTSRLPVPKVVCLEWLDPLMAACNWFPELAEIAGGEAMLSKPGKHSPRIEWDDLLNINPDILLISPCGYGIDQTIKEIDVLKRNHRWNQLEAVQKQHVFLMDGNHYFHRPGPRLVDSAKILAEIFHPGILETVYHETGWINLMEI